MDKFKPGDKVVIVRSKFRGLARQPGEIVTLIGQNKNGDWRFEDKNGSGEWLIDENDIRKLTKLDKALK